MGVVLCPKHGRGFLFVCPHVSDAIHAGKPCPGIEYLAYTDADPELAGIELAGWFCPRCIQDDDLPPNGTVFADGDDFMSVRSALYRPVCPRCFEEWRNQGMD